MTNDELTEREEDNMRQVVLDAVAKLGEQFDNVYVFCSSYDEMNKKTWDFSRGKGNIYAAYGQIKGWINCYEDAERGETREPLEDDDNE